MRVAVGDFLQADTSDGRCLCPEIVAQQLLADSYSLENLCSAVGTDGADAHLAHYFVETLAKSLDVVAFSRFVVHLHIAALHQVVEHGECHIRVDGACSIAKQQCGMHHLPDLSALDDKSGLHTFLHRNQMMVHSTHRQQRRNCHMVAVDALVGQYYVVHTVVDRCLGAAAQLIDGFLQPGGAFCRIKQHWQLHGVESLVSDIAENVELGVGQHGVGQTHHLAVRLAWQKDVHAHSADIFCQRHHQLFADWVYGGVGHLCKLLSEVVEQQLRTAAQHGKRRVVAHRGSRLRPVHAHRLYGAFHVFARESESTQLSAEETDGIVHFASAA